VYRLETLLGFAATPALRKRQTIEGLTMAAANSVAQTTPAPNTEQLSLRGRNRIARTVVLGSFLTLFLLIVAVVGLAETSNTGASDAAKTALNTILPVLAGWVGTVLAFYFSSASQERTSATLDKAIAQSGGGADQSTLVSDLMIPLSKIAAVQKLDDTNTPATISVATLKSTFNDFVTRILFIENGVFKYIVHIGTLNAFLVGKDGNAAQLTFADMLLDPDVLNQISKLVVFVSGSTTLADAKAALDKVPGAQDIIVTATGKAADPMLGWLSNVDLIKASQVS
jgi:hypothetical protein